MKIMSPEPRPETPEHIRTLLKFMADENHSPFYQYEELREAIHVDTGNLGDVLYFGKLINTLISEEEIQMGGAAAIGKYIITKRAEQFSREHEGQIL